VTNPSKVAYRSPGYDGQLVRTVASTPVHSFLNSTPSRDESSMAVKQLLKVCQAGVEGA
jgi:hypothetical protein